MIPMLDLKKEYDYMRADIDAAIARCLSHQTWINGPEVTTFEEDFAKYLSTQNCIGVSSGTEALVLALRALAIKTKGKNFFDPEDKIITTPFTFTATGDAILRSGATPIFMDIDPKTFNLDPVRVKIYLESHQEEVVGLLPVHLYGRACEMNEFQALAEKYNLFIIEDVAQAAGGSYQGKKLGTISDAGCFSFFPSKNLGGFGDGGAIATNDKKLAELIRQLRQHGGKDKYNVDLIGYNARLDAIQAAVLKAKLKYLDEFNAKRQKIAKQYNEGLKGLDHLILPDIPDNHVVHQYTLRVKDKRDDFIQLLKDNNVSSMIYYPISLHQMKVFEGESEIVGELNETRQACKEVVSLPIEPLFNNKEIENIIHIIKTICKKL